MSDLTQIGGIHYGHCPSNRVNGKLQAKIL